MKQGRENREVGLRASLRTERWTGDICGKCDIISVMQSLVCKNRGNCKNREKGGYIEVVEALRIVRCLAEGVDPTTGEVFPADSPYQRGETVRALYTATSALEKVEQRQKREKILPTNAGKSWDAAEDEQLSQHFDAGMTLKELSRQHERTEGAIQSRLVKMGKAVLYQSPAAEDEPYPNPLLKQGEGAGKEQKGQILTSSSPRIGG